MISSPLRSSIGLSVAACAVIAGVMVPADSLLAAPRWVDTIRHAPPTVHTPVVTPVQTPVTPVATPTPVVTAPVGCGRIPHTRTVTIEIPAPAYVAPPPPPPQTIVRSIGGGRARWSQTLTDVQVVAAPTVTHTPVGPTYRTETVTEWVDVPCATVPQTIGVLSLGSPTPSVDPGQTFRTQAVPEPGIFGLLGIGGLAMWMARRRRKA